MNPPADLISVLAGSLVVVLGLLTAYIKERRKNGQLTQSTVVAAIREHEHETEEQRAVAEMQRRVKELARVLPRLVEHVEDRGSIAEQLQIIATEIAVLNGKIDKLKEPNGKGKVA